MKFNPPRRVIYEPVTHAPHTELATLKLSARTRRILIGTNIRTVGDVAELTDAELLRLPMCGRRTLNEIRGVTGTADFGAEEREEQARILEETVRRIVREELKSWFKRKFG